MPFGLGIWEIVILLGVLALLFGAKGVPQVARRLGTGVREMKDAVDEIDPRRMLEAGEPEPAKPSTAKPAAAKPAATKPAEPEQRPPPA
jgi:sec-independent protein translocase protein TatA